MSEQRWPTSLGDVVLRNEGYLLMPKGKEYLPPILLPANAAILAELPNEAIGAGAAMVPMREAASPRHAKENYYWQTPRSERAHERLLSCPGYAAFYAEAEDDDDREMIEAFAGWLIYPGEALERYAKWTADDFRAKWDFWNS